MSIPSVSDATGRPQKRPANKTQQLDRLPPHAVEMEEAVVGCCLTGGAVSIECLDEVQLKLPALEAFYDVRTRAVMEGMRALRQAGKPVDLLSVQQWLRDGGLLEGVGGIAGLSAMQDRALSAANLPAYLAVVAEKWQLRRWLQACAGIAERIHGCERDVEGLVAGVSTELFKLCEANLGRPERALREVLADVHVNVLEKFRRGVKFNIGPTTGFNYLDNILPGLGRGQLIVEGARPRTGKTAKLLQTAEHVAGVCGVPVGIFSLEMTDQSLALRQLFQRGRADLTKFLNGFMAERDVQSLTVAAQQLAALPIYIDESPRMSIEDLEVRCRRLVRQRGVGLIMIDYFQLLFVRNRNRQWSKADELAEVSMRLKGLAKELNIPVYLCAQLNREIEKEVHRRPRLADLKDTGQLEQDADVVMFLWKPDVTSEKWERNLQQILPNVPCPQDWKEGKNWKKNLAVVTCTVEKQREGRSGEDATLVFIKPWTRFVDAYRPLSGTDSLPPAVGPGGNRGRQEEEPDEPAADDRRMPSDEELGLD